MVENGISVSRMDAITDFLERKDVVDKDTLLLLYQFDDQTLPHTQKYLDEMSLEMQSIDKATQDIKTVYGRWKNYVSRLLSLNQISSKIDLTAIGTIAWVAAVKQLHDRIRDARLMVQGDAFMESVAQAFRQGRDNVCICKTVCEAATYLRTVNDRMTREADEQKKSESRKKARVTEPEASVTDTPESDFMEMDSAHDSEGVATGGDGDDEASAEAREARQGMVWFRTKKPSMCCAYC